MSPEITIVDACGDPMEKDADVEFDRAGDRARSYGLSLQVIDVLGENARCLRWEVEGVEPIVQLHPRAILHCDSNSVILLNDVHFCSNSLDNPRAKLSHFQHHIP